MNYIDPIARMAKAIDECLSAAADVTIEKRTEGIICTIDDVLIEQLGTLPPDDKLVEVVKRALDSRKSFKAIDETHAEFQRGDIHL